jgi:hypothetical protein
MLSLMLYTLLERCTQAHASTTVRAKSEGIVHIHVISAICDITRLHLSLQLAWPRGAPQVNWSVTDDRGTTVQFSAGNK